MKTITNKECAGALDEKGKCLTYAQMGVNCLQSPDINHNGQNAGFTPEEMRARIRVQDILEKGGKTIELEDADATKLLQCIKATKWVRVDKDILQFIDDMEAELNKVEEKPKKS